MEIVKRGSRGRAVVALKKRLRAHGFWKLVWGFTSGFGPITESAVRRYQAANGLTVDGQVGPQTWASLNSTPISGKGERARAVAWAKSQVGVTERPAGSNWGHPVQDWIIEAGYNEPEPWCQCFANQVGKAGTRGRLKSRWFGGYTVSVVQMARRGEHGLKPRSLATVQAGDWVYFDWGSGIEHVEVFLAHNADGTIQTIGGNTSFDQNGSQSNGGAVAHKVRPRSVVAACVHVPYRS
jgi:peptidoglycan hydrolase-like protein with peptidoglycan-binding domain